MTVGVQFLAPIFNGNIETLTADEQMLLEQDHHDTVTMLQEEHGDSLIQVVYECKERGFVCPCELTRKFSDCVEVKVYAMVKDGTVEKFNGEY